MELEKSETHALNRLSLQKLIRKKLKIENDSQISLVHASTEKDIKNFEQDLDKVMERIEN